MNRLLVFTGIFFMASTLALAKEPVKEYEWERTLKENVAQRSMMEDSQYGPMIYMDYVGNYAEDFETMFPPAKSEELDQQ